MANAADLSKRGPWAALFKSALTLTNHLATVMDNPVWTFGGAVLMPRLNHRHSRDIDFFVPNPQYLGHLTPRLCDVAEQLTTNYVEPAEYVKLLLPAGDIDIVVGEPLTDQPLEVVEYRGRHIRVETDKSTSVASRRPVATSIPASTALLQSLIALAGACMP